MKIRMLDTRRTSDGWLTKQLHKGCIYDSVTTPVLDYTGCCALINAGHAVEITEPNAPTFMEWVHQSYIPELKARRENRV